MRKPIVLLLCTCMVLSLWTPARTVEAETSLNISAPSAVLMEPSTGQVLYESNSHEALRPASVTKVMTILLAYEAVRDGKASMEDMVTVSENAAGYGGSTILLEAGESIALSNLIKGMCVASGNDAAIATAEYIGGSQDGFVEMMNARAKELGMNDTHFVNPCGLDADGHVTSAYDIALMSRELINNFPEVFEYTTIWHEMMPHQWKKGAGETDMVNTNKLIQSYEGMNGLKTGFTRLAKYSISATAKRGDLQLIAVVMGAETKDQRSADVCTLLDYGFGGYGFVKVETEGNEAGTVPIRGGDADEVVALVQGNVQMLTEKSNPISAESLTKEVQLKDGIEAPVKAGDALGEIVYSLDGKEVARLPLVAAADVQKMDFTRILQKLLAKWM